MYRLSTSTFTRHATCGMILLFTLTLAPAVHADDDAELRALIASLQTEVQSLRAEVKSLKQAQDDQQGELQQARQISDDTRAQLSALESKDSGTLSEAVTGLKNVQSRYGIRVYGYFKADAYHDSSTTSHQDIPFWTLNTGGDSETDFTARETRIGLDMDGPDNVGGGKLTGKLEMDFYGKVPTTTNLNENHAYQLRSRHAYLQWQNDDWTLLAGKTWEPYLLVFPQTLNFGYYNFQGQLGLRRMQFRATRTHKLDNDRKFAITGAVGEPLGSIHGGDADGDGTDDGTDSELPSFAGKLEYTFPGFGERATMLGLSGFYSKEQVAGRSYDAYAVIFGGSVPLTDMLTLKGVIWQGENLDSAWGGIGQGINLTKRSEIAAYGGWTQLRIKPASDYWFNVGYSIDNPDDDDLNAAQRSSNSTIALNGYYKVDEPLTLGLEYFQTNTDYKNAADATNHRIQSSVIYKF